MSTLMKSLSLLAGASLILLGFTSCESGSNVKSGFGRNTTTSQIMGQHRHLTR